MFSNHNANIQKIESLSSRIEERSTAFITHVIDGSVVVSKHPICSETKQIGMGQIVDPLSYLQYVEDLVSQNGQQGELNWINENVLVDNERVLVFYKKSGKAWLHTSNKSYMVSWPPLLFIAHKHKTKFQVCALPSNKRPTPDTALYKVPLANHYDNGSVCLGNTIPPVNITSKSIPEIYNWYFNTKFTDFGLFKQIIEEKRAFHSAEIKSWKKFGTIKEVLESR